MKKLSLFFAFCCFWGLWSTAQIEMSEPEKREPKKKEIGETIEKSTEVYFLTNWSVTYRSLVPNDGLFGDSLGQREDETSLNKWSFGIGLRNRLNEHLGWEGGLAFIRNGESFASSAEDTSFQYKTTYSYIGMPLKLSFLYGNDIQLIASAGVIPQIFMQYNQDQAWTTSSNESLSQNISTKSGYNSFALSSVFNVGAKFKFSDNWSLLVLPEYRIQLTSTYRSTDSYVHKGSAFGVSFGLTIAI